MLRGMAWTSRGYRSSVNTVATIIGVGLVAICTLLLWVLPVILFASLGRAGGIILVVWYAIVWLGFVAWLAWHHRHKWT